MAGAEGETKGPPAASEYAVLPVDVLTSSPSPIIVVTYSSTLSFIDSDASDDRDEHDAE